MNVNTRVIDAVKLQTRIHREPGLDGYQSVADIARDQRLVPTTTAALAVTLAELDLR